jgi:hypothetical protein
MLIAIISDIHDNLINLANALTWCRNQNITKIIFCGDTTTLETIKNLAQFPGEIFMVRGNIELYEKSELAEFKNLKYYGATGSLNLNNLHIGLCHEPYKIERLIKSTETKLDYIFYGHTHKPWLEQRGVTAIINPGNIAGVWYQATFATLNTVTRKIELKILGRL